MKFGSVCSGIEAASVAWEPMGWNASWFAEIEPFPSAVLNHHWPHVSNLGDMTMIAEMVANNEVEAPDVLIGGTPCQAFSVAGARKSLDDHRGQLSLEYIKLANSIDDKRIENQKQPSIIVWENVPGVLNTKDNAFGCFLGALAGESSELQPTGGRWSNAGCVFGPQRAIAWRILDAQYFGVAQRRRRVFVVASARKGFNPAKVLFEWEGVRRDSAPNRETGQDSTAGVGVGFAESSFGQYRECATDSGTLKRSGGVLAGGSETFIVGTLDTQCGYEKAAFQSVEAGHIVVHGTQDPLTQDNQAFPLGRNHGQENVVYCGTQNDACRDVGLEISPTLRAGNGGGAVNPVANIGLVRRLTPIECERLQGFPDNHTQIPYRNKSADQCPDGPRYAACGNSMAVPVMRWIGERIQEVVGGAA